MMRHVVFSIDHTTIEVPEGTTVQRAQIAAGRIPDAVCGGKGTCGKCKVFVNGKQVLACQTKIYEDVVVEEVAAAGDSSVASELLRNYSSVSEEVDKSKRIDISSIHPHRPADKKFEKTYYAAVDLGTTTIVAYLIEATSGEVLGTSSMINPQRKYGADVVERCNHSFTEGKAALSSVVREGVNRLLEQLTAKVHAPVTSITRLAMVGNTGMHHLFLELPTEKLALAPYIPYIKSAVHLPAHKCGIGIAPDTELFWLPNIGGFVGADTSACILASNIYEAKEMTLIVDIGTNGEMVLGNRETGLLACAVAAGPAFEGAKIACGMWGNAGAIDRVYLEGPNQENGKHNNVGDVIGNKMCYQNSYTENDKIRYHVIGERKPIGICGSGLVDAAACLLKTGYIDETGRMEEKYIFSDGVYLCQQDIRELQLAKAAIAAGIRMMCKQKGIRVDQIEKVLLAGAFGNYMNPESACDIGMLPNELRGRIIPIGNAAGEGAVIAARNPEKYEKIKSIAEQMEYLELATSSEFQYTYIEEMDFPEKINNQQYQILSQKAEQMGFYSVMKLESATIEVLEDVRKMCTANTCGMYGKNWSCPPGCGDLKSCKDTINRYSDGILLQTVGDIEDSWDFETMKEIEQKHKDNFAKFVKELRLEGHDILPLGVGACTICGECTYPNQPCRFPDRKISSLEAYGIVVSDLCRQNGMGYYYGPQKMAYTSCVLFN